MRRYLLLLVMAAACGTGKKEATPRELVTGNWFVLYPKEGILNEEQERVYAELQDSLVNEKGLKLISLRPDGHFRQLDSSQEGRWAMRSENLLQVTEGGEGFDDFRASFVSMDKGILKVAEIINKGYPFTLTWYLKKIEKGEAARLFAAESNVWRLRPPSAESEQQLRERLASMLAYYAVYFRLIAAESSYFMPARVVPPLKFYQHAIGTKEWKENTPFARIFYSPEQSKQAYEILKKAIHDAEFDFPSKDSYSEEYALMLDIVATDLRKK